MMPAQAGFKQECNGMKFASGWCEIASQREASMDPVAARLRTQRRSPVHGVTVGIMVLDTLFQRLPGDIGYAPTWPFPVQYAVVRGATGQRVTQTDAGGTLELFLRAADELVALGVDGITTSCGFLAILHPDLVRHCPVPVATSALL